MFEKFKNWCVSDSAVSRCTRTIFQAIIGVIVNFAPDMITGTTVIPYEYKPFVQALVMAILAPIQKSFGESRSDEEEVIDE